MLKKLLLTCQVICALIKDARPEYSGRFSAATWSLFGFELMEVEGVFSSIRPFWGKLR